MANVDCHFVNENQYSLCQMAHFLHQIRNHLQAFLVTTLVRSLVSLECRRELFGLVGDARALALSWSTLIKINQIQLRVVVSQKYFTNKKNVCLVRQKNESQYNKQEKHVKGGKT